MKTIVIINTSYAQHDVGVEYREDVAKGDVRFETRPDRYDLPYGTRDGLRELGRTKFWLAVPIVESLLNCTEDEAMTIVHEITDN